MWLGPSLLYTSTPIAFVSVFRFYRRVRHLAAFLLLAITAAQALFLGGLTLLGLCSDGPAFFLHIMGIRG